MRCSERRFPKAFVRGLRYRANRKTRFLSETLERSGSYVRQTARPDLSSGILRLLRVQRGDGRIRHASPEGCVRGRSPGGFVFSPRYALA